MPTGSRSSFGRTGDPLTFRIHYAAYETLSNVVVGIALHHQNGQHLSGTNTRRSGHTIPELARTGYVDYHVPRLTLLEGTYQLTAAIEDWTESHDYDYWLHGLRFDVLPSTVHEAGYVSLAGQLGHPLVAARRGRSACRHSLSSTDRASCSGT